MTIEKALRVTWPLWNCPGFCSRWVRKSAFQTWRSAASHIWEARDRRLSSSAPSLLLPISQAAKHWAQEMTSWCSPAQEPLAIYGRAGIQPSQLYLKTIFQVSSWLCWPGIVLPLSRANRIQCFLLNVLISAWPLLLYHHETKRNHFTNRPSVSDPGTAEKQQCSTENISVHETAAALLL